MSESPVRVRARQPAVVVVCGVSGSGKSTLGSRLAERLEAPFFDSDDYVPPDCKAKMSSGIPLEDTDRKPWYTGMGERAWEAAGVSGSAVLACSAQKEKYRQWMMKGRAGFHWIYLTGEYDLIKTRMEAREHFMPPSLLRSQFEIMEQPDYALTLEASLSTAEQTEAALEWLQRSGWRVSSG